jgi:hypothetical protein
LAGGFKFGRQFIALSKFQPDLRDGHGVDHKRRKMNGAVPPKRKT